MLILAAYFPMSLKGECSWSCSCSALGMELFEEALRRWEQALTFRSRQVEDEAICGSIKLGAGDAIAEESVEVSTSLVYWCCPDNVFCVIACIFPNSITKLDNWFNFLFSGIVFKGDLSSFLLTPLVGYLEEGMGRELTLFIFWQLLMHQCLLLDSIIKLSGRQLPCT